MKITTVRIIAKIAGTGGDVPEWVLLFAEGIGTLETGETYTVDKAGFDTLSAKLSTRGIDIVFDYEHQTLSGEKAPAAGWITAMRYDDGVGIMAKVDWTQVASGHIKNREYRYFSPVFDVRKSDGRVVGLHSVALTNSPKTNNLQPLVAKKEAGTAQGDDMELKKLIAKLGLPETATEEDVLAKIGELATQKDKTVEVVAKDIKTALELTEADDLSTVVASIHALKQTTKTSVSKVEFDALAKKLLDRDVTEVVAKAMTEGKITPDQKDWATDYATKDMKGFETFIAKAAVVVPITKLGEYTKPKDGSNAPDDVTLFIAKSMGLSAEDLKMYA